MQMKRRYLWFLLALSITATIVPSMIAETPEERIGQALKRSLESSNYALKRQAAELRDVADADWGGFGMRRSLQKMAEQLTPVQYKSAGEKVADEPFAGVFVRHQENGRYICSCGNPLFHSDHKLESGNGYPSFSQAAESTAVVTDLSSAWSHEHDKIELLCGVCSAHLGHVDPGESPDDALSFVVNSSALVFEPTASATADD